MKNFIYLKIFILLFSSCKREVKKKGDLKYETNMEDRKNDSFFKNKMKEKEIYALSYEEATKRMFEFLDKNETVTRDSYKVFYSYFRRHYQGTLNKTEYNSFTNLVKKTLQGKDDYMRNLQYQDLKKEIIKLNNK